MNGVINVLKPPGMTSHDIVSFLRKTLGQKRIGHAGTLDPQAAGVLPVCIGQATRLVDYLSVSDKEYLCHLTLGISTDTQDAWGVITEKKSAADISSELLQAALQCFSGEIIQETPMYSAIKVDGTPLYKLARQGITVEPRNRRVRIDFLELLDFRDSTAVLKVGCSKGTYIRTLCKDIGDYLGVGGHMSFLVRTRVGTFFIDDSLTVEEIAEIKKEAVLSIDRCLEGLQKIILEDKDIIFLKNGRKILFTGDNMNNTIAVLDKEGKLHALAEIITDAALTAWLKPKKVFNLE